MLKIDIITIFPESFDSYFNASIMRRAEKRKLVEIKTYNLRNWATDKHKTVDSRPYGGGPGMILKVDVLYKAIKKYLSLGSQEKCRSKIVLLTPTGKFFNQKIAERFSKLKKLILVCGHYEGFDKRVEKFADEKISVGPYILTGGELGAMIITDAVVRLIPGVIKAESLEEESFSKKIGNGEYPQYTRPAEFNFKDGLGKIKKLLVPKILLSGDHKKIKEWRQKRIKYLKD
ncbi:tRNA (guanosine(37)-N1)-methyltransferase TrmD [bacterium (Candidatus Moisslbacteria) CG12_big_fil_rev_8_21_14_0_65_36_11]|nr:MAG: tRNA (guanosine(37)-N1)-methyltransferase TrmD [Parcubacteria group bacterium CG2_30_36_38]PIW68069.1 MAG: tRNA (guanosine(37)-N1)-methyltransferase TrmD [bacterium (Candidatus Moisslbacteria) CG12_big_fil_rev_8_21_14_0_65_36_11]